MSAIYPISIIARLKDLRHSGEIEHANAVGRSASFECGTSVSFQILVDVETKTIERVSVRSNGCGFMVTAADVLAENIQGRRLTDLHGFEGQELNELFHGLDPFPPDRRHCADAVVAAVKSALADFRHRQIEEFAGEKALICTCFGVTEDAIESTVRTLRLETVDQVGQIRRAGTGCGSCQMMIQELIDSVVSS